MTMLIVDDSPKVREMLKKLFRDEIIYECSDGADALAIYTQYHPDWVLMDVKMRNVDGITATKSIVERFPDAHVIIVTQYDDRLTREQALFAGAIDFVLKENIYTLPDIMKPGS
jgi:two-component system response regulator DegU